jgi:hypothetical protein
MIAVHAAAAARERTRVLDAFRVHDATAPDRARPFASPKAFYLDEASAIVDRNRGFGNPRRRKLLLLITIGLAVLAAVLAVILVLLAREPAITWAEPVECQATVQPRPNVELSR